MDSNLEMRTNSSMDAPDSFNVSLHPPCRISLLIPYVFEGFMFTNSILFLPLCSLVIFVGCQRWRKRHHASSEATHPLDIFCYHMVAMDTMGSLAGACLCIGFNISDLHSFMVGSWSMFYILSCGKIQFLMLTCVEFYLAVVHPVLYRSLRSPSGVRIRNFCVAWVWFLCALCGVISSFSDLSMIQNLFFFLVGFVLAVVLFCCLSVLWTLRHQKVKDRVDPSKKKAFLSIVFILMVIWLCLIALLVFQVLDVSFNTNNLCVSTSFMYFFTLPCSLVLPLLFLQRAKELPKLSLGRRCQTLKLCLS
ncbi:uncharacterized protein LOC112156247 [Oryzias melastigma]|uniref:uncharacterized protein LOC112156247 n=1 Tax=Oryzias melastigma TaxID=30732 RepID=UPI000CF7BF4A|nr:uncharacterized protein LOC112156247 [Oryzias melastigma]